MLTETIGIICSYPPTLIMGTASLIGALTCAGYSVYQKKKAQKEEYKFDIKKIVDTVWQSTLMGVAASSYVACGSGGIIVAMICGYGVDRLTNKLQINKTQIFNFVQLIMKYITKK